MLDASSLDLLLSLPSPSGNRPPPLPLAGWHQADPCPVVNASIRARQAAPHLAGLADFILPRSPGAVLASSSIKGVGDRPSSRVTRLEEALGHQWISWNGRAWTNAETVDVDHAGWRERLAALTATGYPAPAMMVISPWKGSAHLTWFYESPIRNDDPEQVRIRRGVRRGLNAWFDGCSRFANRLTKNPFAAGLAGPDPDHPCDAATWAAYQASAPGTIYHTETGDLTRHQALDLLRPLMPWATGRKLTLLSPKREPQGTPAIHVPGAHAPDQRGTRLFYASARAVWRACTGKADTIAAIVERTATTLRSPATPGDQAQVSASITRWMNTEWWGPLDGRPGWDGRTGRRDVDHGVMTGEAADAGPQALADWQGSTVQEKRQAAALRSRALVKDRTTAALEAALAGLAADGEVVTQAAVAARAGVSVRTVGRRWATLGGVRESDSRSNPLLRGGIPPASPPSNQASSTSLLLASDLARRSRQDAARDRAAVAAYNGQAARMGLPGAQAEAVSPPSKGAAAGPTAAHRRAMAARRDLVRRIEGRRRRAAASVRAAERDAWHAAHMGDADAWKARVLRLESDHAEDVRRILQHRPDADLVEMGHRSMMSAERCARGRAEAAACGKAPIQARPLLTPNERAARRIERLCWPGRGAGRGSRRPKRDQAAP